MISLVLVPIQEYINMILLLIKPHQYFSHLKRFKFLDCSICLFCLLVNIIFVAIVIVSLSSKKLLIPLLFEGISIAPTTDSLSTIIFQYLINANFDMNYNFQ